VERFSTIRAADIESTIHPADAELAAIKVGILIGAELIAVQRAVQVACQSLAARIGVMKDASNLLKCFLLFVTTVKPC
jgi:hypothetical protein